MMSQYPVRSASSSAKHGPNAHQAPIFRMRIIEVDHYMAAPVAALDPTTSLYSGRPLTRVPVLRIFGTTPAGQKACLHVHNYLPYFFVPLPYHVGKKQNDVGRYLVALGKSIEVAFAELSERRRRNSDAKKEKAYDRRSAAGGTKDRRGDDSDTDNESSITPDQPVPDYGGKRKHELIYALEVISARPIFGYQPYMSLYIKLILTNPNLIKAVANILQSGCLLRHVFQPFEAHIPYTLQFFADKNLYGMDFIDLAKVTFRRPIPDAPFAISQRSYTNYKLQQSNVLWHYDSLHSFSQSSHVWTSNNTPLYMLASLTQKRSVRSELEADALADHILNSNSIHRKTFSQTDDSEKLVQSLAQIWQMEVQRRQLSDGNSDDASTILESLQAPRSPPREPQHLDRIENAWRRKFDVLAALDAQYAEANGSTAVIGNDDDEFVVKRTLTESNIEADSCRRRSLLHSAVILKQRTLSTPLFTEQQARNAASQNSYGDSNSGGLLSLLTPATQASTLRRRAIDNEIGSKDVADVDVDLDLLFHSQNVDATLPHQKYDLPGGDKIPAEEGTDVHNGGDVHSEDEADSFLDDVEKAQIEEELKSTAFRAEARELQEMHRSIDGVADQLDSIFEEPDNLSQETTREAMQVHADAAEKRQRNTQERIILEDSVDLMFSQTQDFHESHIEVHNDNEPFSQQFTQVLDTEAATQSATPVPTPRSTQKLSVSQESVLYDTQRTASSSLQVEAEERYTDEQLRNNEPVPFRRPIELAEKGIAVDNSALGVAVADHSADIILQCCALPDRLRSRIQFSYVLFPSSRLRLALHDQQLEQQLKLTRRAFFSSVTHLAQYHKQHFKFASAHARFYPAVIEGPSMDASSWSEAPSVWPVSNTPGQRHLDAVMLRHLADRFDAQLAAREESDESDEGSDGQLFSSSFVVWNVLNSASPLETFRPDSFLSNSFRFTLQPMASPPRAHFFPQRKSRFKLGDAFTHGSVSDVVAENYGLQKRIDNTPTATQMIIDDDEEEFDARASFATQSTATAGGANPSGTTEIGDDVPLRPASPKFSETFNMEISYFLRTPASTKSKQRTGARFSNANSVSSALTTQRHISLSLPQSQSSLSPTRELLYDDEEINESNSSSDAEAKKEGLLNQKLDPLHLNTKRNSGTMDSSDSVGNSRVSKNARTNGSQPENAAHTATARNGEEPHGQLFHSLANDTQHLTAMCIEVHANSRQKSELAAKRNTASASTEWLLPDPLHDPVLAIIYHVKFIIHGHEHSSDDSAQLITGVVMVPTSTSDDIDAGNAPHGQYEQLVQFLGLPCNVQLTIATSETALFNSFVATVHQFDPDILCGFEVQKASLGYLLERSSVLKRTRNLAEEIGRILPGVDPARRQAYMRTDAAAIYAQTHSSGLTVPGRVVLNLWRLFRDEVKLNHYTFENVCWQVLRERYFFVHNSVLTEWWQDAMKAWRQEQANEDDNRKSAYAVLLPQTHTHSSARALPANRTHIIPGSAEPLVSSSGLFRCLQYYLIRVSTCYRVLDTLDIIGRTSELGRVFGIKFFDVLDRGSQYRVESMMLRIAKPKRFLLTSLSPSQRANQPAMEAMPLIMEPMSRFYTDPVLVLDFQSLYPSMMIGYNICFTTCLGKVPQNPDQVSFEEKRPGFVSHALGGHDYERQVGLLQNSRESIWVSPNGVMFMQKDVRQGVLPRMLREILDTRVMVKSTMKLHDVRKNKQLHRILNARQFGLKLIANVTYGYTSAGFSGRMPCAEIADAIVATARWTLERAVTTVEANARWNAKVLYGDTDSLFVLLQGRTKEDAFEIGKEIVASVSAENPTPVKLQLEKIYLPCLLVSKKRYVGYKYESPQQQNPILDAKGIELVRRDGVPALVKMMDKVIHLLFSTRDVSLVRSYLERQWQKIWAHRLSVENFVFCKEVRLGTYRQLPLAAIVATRALQQDRRAEPVHGVRVPYVIVEGAPGERLFDRVLSPQQLLAHPTRYRLAAAYYCERVINPALGRLLDIVGVDIKAWYAATSKPKVKRGIVSLDATAVRYASSGHHHKLQVGPDGLPVTSRLIDQFYVSQECAGCQQVVSRNNMLFCDDCLANTQLLTWKMMTALRKVQVNMCGLLEICRECVRHDHTLMSLSEAHNNVLLKHNKKHPSRKVTAADAATPSLHSIDYTHRYGLHDVPCISLDCPLYYQRRKTKEQLRVAEMYVNELQVQSVQQFW